MKHYTLLLFVLLTMIIVACAPAETNPVPEPTQTAVATAQPAANHPAQPCGDGVCGGPENAQNCPADCAANQTQATTAPPASPAANQSANPPTAVPPTTPEPAAQPAASTQPANTQIAEVAFPPLTAPTPCGDPLCYQTSLDLLSLLQRPLAENVLKLFTAVSDPVHNRVYVAGILTPGIAVLDGETEEWVDVFDSGLPSPSLKYLYLDPAANILYIFNATSSELTSMDLNNKTQLARTPIEGVSGQLFVADTGHGRLYALQDNTLRGYDGRTFTQVISAPLPGQQGGPMVYDAATDRIFILAAGQHNIEHLIYVFDAAAGQFTDPIAYNAPAQSAFLWMDYDPAQAQFALASDRVALLLDENGRELTSFPLADNLDREDMAYLPDSGHLIFVGAAAAAAGQITSNQSEVAVYDVGDGRLQNQFEVGHKTHRMTYNPANGRIYLPNGDASIVWRVDSASFDRAVPLRLGDSVEDMVVSGDGRYLTADSRLGGSYLAAFDLVAGQMSTFANGIWPIPLEPNAAGDRLFVLNAWDSTLDVYDYTGAPALLGSIPLGLPPGSTDRLPDLSIDSQNHLAYAAYPEFGQVAVVDWQAMTAVTLIDVPGTLPGDESGGPGNLQTAVNPAANRLYVFDQDNLELLTYDTTQGYALIGQQSIRRQWPLTMKMADLLFADTTANRLFVGPLEFDGVTGAATGRSLAQGDVVFALDETNGRYLTARLDGRGSRLTPVLAALDRDTLATQWTQPLAETAVLLPPAFAWNPVRREIYAGYMTDARIDVYTINQ